MALYESLGLLFFYSNTVYIILKMKAFVNIKIRPIYQEIVQTLLPMYGIVFKQTCIAACSGLLCLTFVSFTKGTYS